MCLATATAAASELGSWIVIAFLVLSGISSLITVASYFATRREVSALEKRMDSQEDKIGRVEKVLRDEATGGLGLLHEKVNGFGNRLSKMEGLQEGHTALLARVENKLDRFLIREK